MTTEKRTLSDSAIEAVGRAIEAAAIALYKIACEIGGEPPRWDDISPDSQAVYRIEARAAIEAYEASAWRPIEEATQDGTVVLLWKPDERRVGEYLLAGYFDEEGPYAGHWVACSGTSLGYFSESAGKNQGYPTHFRPLPEPPKGEK